MTPALPREERAAEVLREHQHKRFCWECTCDGQHTYQGDLADRQATLAAHQAAMLAAAGLLGDPDALDAAEAEVRRLRRLLGMVPPPFVNDPQTMDEARQKIAGLRGALVTVITERDALAARHTALLGRGRAHVASLVEFARTAPTQEAEYEATMTARLIEHIIGDADEGGCGPCAALAVDGAGE